MFAIHTRVPAKNKMDQAVFFLILFTGAFDISSSLPREFYFVNELKNWQDAQSYCRANYVDLATIESLADVTLSNAAVKGMVPGYIGAVWIGLRRNWGWTTGDPLTYNHPWDVGQPNEGTAEAACLVLFSGAWGDYYCSTSFPFYCYDASPTAINKYVLIQNGDNWTNAQTYCKQHYTDLAIVLNDQDAAQVSGTGWIGLISSQWSDGVFSSYRNWASGSSESSLVSQCSAMSMSKAGKWIGTDCNLLLPFLCYGSKLVPRQYHYVDYQKTWLDAQTYCRLKFTDLATIASTNDVKTFMNEASLGYSGSLWIGLNRGTQALWGWSKGDEPFANYNNWDAGRPNGSGACAVNVNNFWRDYDCNALLYFVCYNEGTGYIMVQSNKKWLDAQRYCRSTYTDLATIRNPLDQKQLIKLVGTGVLVWIGLYQDSWKWSDQWSLLFRNWGVNQPSSTAGDCTATSNSGNWSVQDCNTARPFVCYAAKGVMKKSTIRIKLSYSGTANINDPSMQTAILNEIVKKYFAWSRVDLGHLRWKILRNGNVFVKQPTHGGNVSGIC